MRVKVLITYPKGARDDFDKYRVHVTDVDDAVALSKELCPIPFGRHTEAFEGVFRTLEEAYAGIAGFMSRPFALVQTKRPRRAAKEIRLVAFDTVAGPQPDGSGYKVLARYDGVRLTME